ncbi:TYR3-like protein, partial [Mya arenaria]
MPYWDCSLEAALDIPRFSSLFSEDFLGNGDGYVVNGPFKAWEVQTGTLYRTVGITNSPLNDRNITYMMEQSYIANISYPAAGKDMELIFEFIHNRVHHWVGGEMKSIETAADDPIFYPYHSFVSLVWAEFRALQREKGIDPEIDWDEFYGQSRHNIYAPMGLGSLMAVDGSSDIFEENIIFADRPQCSRLEPDSCGTPNLFCNVTIEKCSPWTINEYTYIKINAEEAGTSIQDVIGSYKESKLKKGYEELKEQFGTDVEWAVNAAPYLSDNIEDLFAN